MLYCVKIQIMAKYVRRVSTQHVVLVVCSLVVVFQQIFHKSSLNFMKKCEKLKTAQLVHKLT